VFDGVRDESMRDHELRQTDDLLRR